MANIIATNSCHRQQLIRGSDMFNLQPMVANTKDDFAQRLAKACEEAEKPIKRGRGRRAELLRRVKDKGLDVSGESVRKWLSAESIPSMDNLRFVAIALGVDADWLLTGRPSRTESAEKSPTATTLEAKDPATVIYGQFNPTISKVISIMEGLGDSQQHQILGFAMGLSQADLPDAQNSTKRAGL